jgi:hypothetical protein
MAQALIEAAYRLGARDARLGHAESHPIRPFTSEELHAYREGYRAWKKEKGWHDDQELRDASNSSDLRYRMWRQNQEDER